MPDLGWYLGYPFALGLRLAVALDRLGHFWRKRWIGSRHRHASPEPKPR